MEKKLLDKGCRLKNLRISNLWKRFLFFLFFFFPWKKYWKLWNWNYEIMGGKFLDSNGWPLPSTSDPLLECYFVCGSLDLFCLFSRNTTAVVVKTSVRCETLNFFWSFFQGKALSWLFSAVGYILSKRSHYCCVCCYGVVRSGALLPHRIICTAPHRGILKISKSAPHRPVGMCK